MSTEVWSLIIGSSSVVIALCALIFTIWQGIQTRKHNRISVTPKLNTWTHTDGENHRVTFVLINNGLGPAIINSYEVLLDGEVIEGENSEVIESLVQRVLPHEPHRVTHSSYLANGFMMAEKTKATIASIVFIGQSPPHRIQLEEAFDRLDLVIKYKSVYGDSFTLNTSER